MKKVIIYCFILVNTILNVSAQCTAPVLTVNNPSFEGTPAPHVTPPGWDICMPGKTPDTQPGFWGQTLPPSNGNSYLGIVYAPSSSWQEGAGQTLSSPMVAGTNYSFTIDIATPASANPSTGIVLPPWCAKLQLWGGMSGINGGCHQGELLWESPEITNTTWQTYSLNFTPTSNWDHILFNIYATPPACTDGQYLFVDNMTPINPIIDLPQFDADTVCLGETTTFTDMSIANSGLIEHWVWDFGDGSQTDTSQNPTHTYTSANTFYVTLTIITDVPCTTNVIKQVVVKPNPVINVTANPDKICSGTSATLTASGADNYIWSDGLGTSSGVSVSPLNTYTFYVTGTTDGCSDTSNVTVQTGFLDISANLVNNVLCNGNSDGSASITINNGTAPYSYLWAPSGNIVNTPDNLPAGDYAIIVNDSLNCIDTAYITITEPDELTAFISDSVDILCNGDIAGSATVTVSGGTTNYTYNWSPSGGANNTTTAIAAGNYHVTVTDANGCTVSAQVTINEPPEISPILTPTNENCPNSCDGSINTSVSGGVTPYTFHWSTFPTEYTQNITGLCSGDYTITITDSNNCQFQASIYVGTDSYADAEFYADPIVGLAPLDVEFTHIGTNADTYNWDLGDGSTSTESDPSHNYSEAGLYVVYLYINSGYPNYCEDTFSMVITVIQPSLLDIPNVFTPNQDGVNDLFQVRELGIKEFSAIIFNRWGKKVYEWNKVEMGWDGTHKSGGKCSAGTYYYIIDAVGFDSKEYHIHGAVTLIR